MRWSRRLVRPALAVAITAAAFTASARAHGTIPETERLAIHPTDPDVWVVQTSFGLLVTEDAGASWGWICPGETRALETEDPRLVVTADGSIVLGVFAGLLLGTDLGCSFSAPSADLDGVVVIDVDRGPDGAIFALTSSGGRPNGVHRSSDDGHTWSPAGPPIDTVLFESIRVAPSDARRVYLTGSVPPRPGEPRLAWTYRSDDGGGTFERIDAPALDGGRNFYLLGVDAGHADIVYAVVPFEMADDRLLRSDDGGRTFVEVLRAPDVRALASDGRGTVWVGGREGTGLLRSDGGAPFVRVGELALVGCLVWHAERLFACTSETVDGFAVGASTDGGVTFEPLLDWSRVTATRACDAGASTSLACVPEEPWLESTLRPPSAPPSSCAVRPTGAARVARLELAILVLSALAARRRGRGRRRRAPALAPVEVPTCRLAPRSSPSPSHR